MNVRVRLLLNLINYPCVCRILVMQEIQFLFSSDMLKFLAAGSPKYDLF